MSVAFRIAAPADLAQHLLADPEIKPVASATEVSAEEKGRLNFDLGTATTVITIVVSLAKLGEYAVKIASVVQEWRKRTPEDSKVVLQGPTQDKVIRLQPTVTVEVLAKEIESVARE